MTVDFWTNLQMKTFFRAILHFINKHFKPICRMLGCNEFEGRHTSIDIAAAYEEIVTKFKIQREVKKWYQIMPAQ